MKKMLMRVACAIALVALGWAAGRAQGRPEPQFVLHVEAPQGWTKVVCVRGCELVGARSSTTAQRISEFVYGCGVDGVAYKPEPASPSGPLRCQGTALGWLTK